MGLNCLLKRFSSWLIKANITLKFDLSKNPLVGAKSRLEGLRLMIFVWSPYRFLINYKGGK